jgi:P27 family predicted phage terminase small subunit
VRRLPTATKQLRGTLRADRINTREPRPQLGAPPASRSLPFATRSWRKRLVALMKPPMRVLTVADGPALELLAAALAEYDAASRVLLELGVSYECTTAAGAVMRRARPEQAIAADAWRRAAHMLEQFGLTPAARGRVQEQPSAKPSSRWSGLLGLHEGPTIERFREARRRPRPIQGSA